CRNNATAKRRLPPMYTVVSGSPQPGYSGLRPHQQDQEQASAVPSPHLPRYNVATVSEKEPFAIGSAYVSRLRVKYANRFDNFKANTGKSNGVDTRTDSAQVDAASDTGSEPLVDQQDELLWVGQVGVGTPAQTVTLDFDTGSSDTWVSPSIYKPSASSSAKKTGKTFRGAHGDGSNATGNIYLESFTVGGLTAVKQAFGTATKSTVQDR
ncbi:unnamed protein product, partial [Tilletia laevis]